MKDKYSKEFLPIWEEFAKQSKQKNEWVVARLEATVNLDVVNAFNARPYPALLM